MRIAIRLIRAIGAALAATTHHGYIRQHGSHLTDASGGGR